MQSVYTISLGAGALALALLLQGLFRRGRSPFGAHLIFALHYVSFMYLVTAAAGIGRNSGVSTSAAVLLAFAAIAGYLIPALKRVYTESIGSVLWKAAAVLILTLMINNLASAFAIRVTLAMV